MAQLGAFLVARTTCAGRDCSASIRKQLSTKVVELHDHASLDAVRVVTTVLRDSQYLAAVDEACAKLTERGSDTTELPNPPPPAEVM